MTARATVSPPKPLSNIPIGRSIAARLTGTPPRWPPARTLGTCVRRRHVSATGDPFRVRTGAQRIHRLPARIQPPGRGGLALGVHHHPLAGGRPTRHEPDRIHHRLVGGDVVVPGDAAVLL